MFVNVEVMVKLVHDGSRLVSAVPSLEIAVADTCSHVQLPGTGLRVGTETCFHRLSDEFTDWFVPGELETARKAEELKLSVKSFRRSVSKTPMVLPHVTSITALCASIPRQTHSGESQNGNPIK